MTAVYEQFASRAGDYGVTVRRVPPADAADAVADLAESPAVGVELPWDDVSLPPSVERDPTGAALDRAVTGVTAAALGVADYGTMLLRADGQGSEPVSLFVDRHVAVLRASDLVADMPAAFELLGEDLRETRDSTILATGPSATADMGALVQGAHGPKSVAAVVVDSPEEGP